MKKLFELTEIGFLLNYILTQMEQETFLFEHNLELECCLLDFQRVLANYASKDMNDLLRENLDTSSG